MTTVRELIERENSVIEAGFEPVSASRLAALRERQQKETPVVQTFLPRWNRACRGEGGGLGLAYGWYVLLAGLTGTGKTLLALNLVATALTSGVSILFVSLEMSWEQLVTRLRPIVSGVEVSHLEWGPYFRPEKAEAADRAILEQPGALYFNTEAIWRLKDIRHALEHHAERGVRLVILDYAQLVAPDGSDRKLFEAMSEISSQLRYEAKRLGVVCVVLSQLNRSATRERQSPPTIDGLFGSSRFGFDADQVLALDYSKRDRDPLRRAERTRLLLLKNRHGPALTGESAVDSTLDFATFRVTETAE